MTTDHRAPTAFEQWMLERINLARLDPAAEASRLGIGLNDGLAPGTINTVPKQPLAFNLTLIDAARGHSRWMLDEGVFRHAPGRNGSNPGDRMAEAGYAPPGRFSWAENISWGGSTGALDLVESISRQHDGLFRSPGHRQNLLEDRFAEIGVGQEFGAFQVWNASMITQKFGWVPGRGPFLTGVVFRDLDSDGHYDPGEGRSVQVVTPTASTTAWTSGGYTLAVSSGEVTATFSGGDLAASVTVRALVGDRNVKLDLVNGGLVRSSAEATTLVSGASALELLPGAVRAVGSAAADHITGNAGANQLFGGGGNDHLYGLVGNDRLEGGAGDDVLDGGPGNDRLFGGLGNDRLFGGPGNDRLEGGAGNDALSGGTGADVLVGGTGRDRFVFASIHDSRPDPRLRDTILDFVRGQDRIDLSAIDANQARAGKQGFVFIGESGFSAPGQVRLRHEAGDTVIEANVNRDLAADFAVRLIGFHALSAADFLLG